MVFRVRSCTQNSVCIKQSQVRKNKIWRTNCLAPAEETVCNAFQTLQICPTSKLYYTLECENINWHTLFCCKLKGNDKNPGNKKPTFTKCICQLWFIYAIFCSLKRRTRLSTYIKHIMYKKNNFLFHRNNSQKIRILGVILKALHCFPLHCSNIYFSADKEAVLTWFTN